eukprot:TRINITY_DN2300_c0_g1_i5.p1 TRINITY_DN2300_c0_g1~~TRINITY_DN2300_c0_g1_i5.p1  ORF type:complete len:106 (+),score=12.89 TRINITY_DN2300_c0_g1_i5:415-732(+)
MLKTFLESELYPKERIFSGEVTPLLLAAQEGHLECLKYLLDSCPPRLKLEMAEQAIIHAVHSNSVGVVRFTSNPHTHTTALTHEPDYSMNVVYKIVFALNWVGHH